MGCFLVGVVSRIIASPRSATIIFCGQRGNLILIDGARSNEQHNARLCDQAGDIDQ